MSATDIAAVDAWEALDSRGWPVVSCSVHLAGGARARATVPAGASTGAHEARELRDGQPRYDGRGVLHAVDQVRQVLGPAVVGRDADDQRGLDRALRECDSAADLSTVGANGVLAVSVASALAAAAGHGMALYERLGSPPLLPMPMVNVISGGAHAGGVIDIQDFLVVPVAASSFREAIEWSAAVRRATQAVALERGLPAATLVADEGGLGLPLRSNRAALELLCEGIERAGLEPGADVEVAIDVAATQLWSPAGYVLRSEDRCLSAAELVAELAEWRNAFPICSIEDPLAEDDWPGWRLTSGWSDDIQVVGDDLFATDAARVRHGIGLGAANAVLVKPNQSGTLTGAFDVVIEARRAGYATVVSARSGDTEDSWLADLAVGWAAGQIKVGSTTRAERTAKWNRLLEIEHQLADRARFAGRSRLGRQPSG